MEFLSEDIINKFKILRNPRNVYNNYMLQYLNEPYHNFDKGCNKFGVYGCNCNMTCPTNCKNDICHIQNGNCYTCKPGWTGISCETSKTYINSK